MPLTFPIEARHLIDGKPYNEKENPVSLAIKEKVPKFNLEVENRFAFIGKTVFKLGKSLQKFIQNYDENFKRLPNGGIMHNIPTNVKVTIDLVKKEINLDEDEKE